MQVLVCGDETSYKWLQVHVQACETPLDTQTLSHGFVVHPDIPAFLSFKGTLYIVTFMQYSILNTLFHKGLI